MAKPIFLVVFQSFTFLYKVRNFLKQLFVPITVATLSLLRFAFYSLFTIFTIHCSKKLKKISNFKKAAVKPIVLGTIHLVRMQNFPKK